MLASGFTTTLNTAELFGKDSIVNCLLIMKVGDGDLGPFGPSDDGAFLWSMEQKGSGRVGELVYPFANEASLGSYQWVGGDEPGQISVLLSYSASGRW